MFDRFGPADPLRLVDRDARGGTRLLYGRRRQFLFAAFGAVRLRDDQQTGGRPR